MEERLASVIGLHGTTHAHTHTHDLPQKGGFASHSQTCMLGIWPLFYFFSLFSPFLSVLQTAVAEIGTRDKERKREKEREREERECLGPFPVLSFFPVVYDRLYAI